MESSDDDDRKKIKKSIGTGEQNTAGQKQKGIVPTKNGDTPEDNKEESRALMAEEQNRVSDDQIEVVVDEEGAAAEGNQNEADNQHPEEINGEEPGLFRRLWLRLGGLWARNKKYVLIVKTIVQTLISISMYFFDVGSDIKLAIKYRNEGSMKYFWPTLAFIVIPYVCLVLDDLQMVVTDRKRWLDYYPVDKNQGEQDRERAMAARRCLPKIKCYKTCSLIEDKTLFIVRVVIAVLGLGFIVRKMQHVFFEIKSKTDPKEDWVRWYKIKKFEANRDSHTISFVSSFMEDIPQSLLQLYIYVQNPVSLFSTIGYSITSSLVNLPLKYMNYYKSNRRHVKDELKRIRPDLHIVSTVCYYLAFLGAVVARMLSVSIFIGTVSFQFGIVVLVLHYLGSILFTIFIQRPRYLGQTFGEGKWPKRISVAFNTMLFSMVNIFLYYDLSGREGKGFKIIINNLVIYIENCTFLVLSVTLVENEYAYIFALAIGIGSFMHWSLLTAYYILFHPTQGMCKRCRKSEPAQREML